MKVCCNNESQESGNTFNVKKLHEEAGESKPEVFHKDLVQECDHLDGRALEANLQASLHRVFKAFNSFLEVILAQAQ